MSNYAQFALSPIQRSPTSIVSSYSDGNYSTARAYYSGSNAKKVLSGALTAATYKTMLDITGSGVFDYCAAVAEDATSRTIGLKITIDGTVVFDAVSNAIILTGAGIMGIGTTSDGSTGKGMPNKIPFNISFKAEIKSSLEETDKISICYSYQLA